MAAVPGIFGIWLLMSLVRRIGSASSETSLPEHLSISTIGGGDYFFSCSSSVFSADWIKFSRSCLDTVYDLLASLLSSCWLFSDANTELVFAINLAFDFLWGVSWLMESPRLNEELFRMRRSLLSSLGKVCFDLLWLPSWATPRLRWPDVTLAWEARFCLNELWLFELSNEFYVFNIFVPSKFDPCFFVFFFVSSCLVSSSASSLSC